MKRFSYIFICLLTLCSAQLIAQETQEERVFSLDDIEQSENITPEAYQDLEKLEEKLVQNNITLVPFKESKFKKSKYSPPVFRALLKRNSLLIPVDGNESQKTGHEIFVKAQQKIFGDRFVYILDKNGNWVYRTEAINLATIEKDVSLNNNTIKANEEYPQSFRHNLVDHKIKFSHRFTFAIESMQAYLYEDLLNKNNFDEANANRFEWRIFYHWQVPVQFGLSLNYQNGNYSEGTLTWQAFQFGPFVKYPLMHKDNITINISSGVQKSALYTALTNNIEIGLTALTWHVDIDALVKTEWGNWILGFEYRDQNTGISKDPELLTIDDSTKESIKSFGFVIGREFDFFL